MVPLESQTVVEKNPSTSVDAKEQLVSSKDEEVSTIAVQGASSLESPKGAQEGASFMGKGGEQQFGYQPNVHSSQPQTLFSGGYLNHLGQWEEYPYVASVEGLDSAYPVSIGLSIFSCFLVFPDQVLSGFTGKLVPNVSPRDKNNQQVMYGAYSPLSTFGDSQSYFPFLYPISSPYYQPAASPSTVYSSSATGLSQFDPMHKYYLPDELHYSLTPGFHQPFGSFDSVAVTMQSSGVSEVFGQGIAPLSYGMHQESMGNSGSYTAFHQGGKFGGGTPCWKASSRFGTFNKGFKHEKGSVDFLNEQSRGPRAAKTKKEVESSSAEDKNTLLMVDPEKYNHPDFATDYKDAKFFIIKSYTEDHIHKSIKYNVWASTASGNRKLNSAYREAKEREDHCPIFMFFSVNGSGQFCGVAEMVGPVDFDRSVDYWQNDRWSGQFPVKWHIVKDVPNNLVRHIILENNENKRVTNSRDTQEVKLEQGVQMLAIFKNHGAETTILEDFDFYEQREKAMLDDRHQWKVQCAEDEAQKLVKTSAAVDIGTQISDTIAQAVQLEESKDREIRLKIEDTATAENASAAPVKTEEAMPKTAHSGTKES